MSEAALGGLAPASPGAGEPRRPERLPADPNFSSGPCAKRPGWSPAVLSEALVGRSHRSGPGKTRLAEVIERSKALLGIPEGYRLAIVPGSDTGAFEMAMWSLLGSRGVDLFAWESFGSGWVTDAVKQLKLEDTRLFEAPYGRLADLSQYDGARDAVFCWNGTTSGVRVPNGEWIPANREGLTLCDATSAVFAMDLPFDKLDVVTWSWQKALGGEAAHGMLLLSPRAVERLESWQPPRPLPKVFRLTKGGKLIEGAFRGETLNTPSMLAVEDVLDALRWAEGIGGVPAMIGRAEANLALIAGWVEERDWVGFLAEEPETRSPTSVCLALRDPWFQGLESALQAKLAKEIAGLLAEAGAGYDIGSYRDAPPGLRIWAGATVERDDLAALLPWLDWAFETVKQRHLS